MSKDLWEYYHRAHEIGGLPAQIRLAAITELPAAKIGDVEATPEIRLRFKEALRQLEKEFLGDKASRAV